MDSIDKFIQYFWPGMKIGFDAKRLFHNDTGLGVYSRLLVHGLKENHPEEEYILFAKSPARSKYYPAFKDFRIVSNSRPLWRTSGICRDINREHCDVFHGLSHELPVGIQRLQTKSIVTIHDVIFKIEPHLYRKADRIIYDLKWRHSCKVADLIVTVSDHTRNDLCNLFKVDAKKIQVLPPPVAQKVFPGNLIDIQKKYALPVQFYLSVGSLTARKNVKSILKAMCLLAPRDRIPLVIVGSGQQAKDLKKFAIENKLEKLVHFVGQIESDELGAFYQLSFALIYPSYYEGFGIPVVESLQNKRPVITSNTSSLPEAAGPGAIFIDPKSPKQLAHKMSLLPADTDLYNKLAEAGYDHSLQFSKENICKKQMEIYRKLA
ncbi:MAG: glycosyltransferase family 4 protein [Saprospiraceae bacterium]|nr:glycosyltransferase family 4 protein [Saprospiraceae bacterium]